MFCGNHDAAENGVILYYLPGFCAEQVVNPREWLAAVLAKIPYYSNNYRIGLADLLSHNWKVGQALQNAPLDIQ